MGGLNFNEPGAAAAGVGIGRFPLAYQQNINCLDDYVRREQEDYLTVNPGILNPKCKVVDYFQELWKYQSKMHDLYQEFRDLLDNKVYPRLDKIQEKIEFSGGLRHSTLTHEQLKNLRQDLDKVIQEVERDERRFRWARARFMTMRDRATKTGSIQLKKTLHPDLPIQIIVEFYCKCNILQRFIYTFSKEVLQFHERWLDVLHQVQELYDLMLKKMKRWSRSRQNISDKLRKSIRKRKEFRNENNFGLRIKAKYGLVRKRV